MTGAQSIASIRGCLGGVSPSDRAGVRIDVEGSRQEAVHHLEVELPDWPQRSLREETSTSRAIYRYCNVYIVHMQPCIVMCVCIHIYIHMYMCMHIHVYIYINESVYSYI